MTCRNSTSPCRFFCVSLAWSVVFVFCFFSLNPNAEAQSSASYSYELEPVYSINLPKRILGREGTLQVLGLRSAFQTGSGAVQFSLLAQHDDPDRIYTIDSGYRFELQFQNLELLAMFGVHVSKFSISTKLDELGDCTTLDCQTDSGIKLGLYGGGGVQIPIQPNIPLRLSMRFYTNPSIWLLIELGVGFRF